MFFLFYCFSLFMDYVLLVHQHLYSAVLEHICSLLYFWSLKIFYRPPSNILKGNGVLFKTFMNTNFNFRGGSLKIFYRPPTKIFLKIME